MVLQLFSCSVMSDSLWPHGLYVAHQSPLAMEFSRQEYWSGLTFPTPGDLLQNTGKSKNNECKLQERSDQTIMRKNFWSYP